MVFEDTYGNADKKSIKEQRNLVTALLKYKKVDESLEECEDILVFMFLFRKKRRECMDKIASKWVKN